MKKTTMIAIAVLVGSVTAMVTGCSNGAIETSSDDSAIAPSSKTNIEGATRTGDEVVAPTVGDAVVAEAAPSEEAPSAEPTDDGSTTSPASTASDGATTTPAPAASGPVITLSPSILRSIPTSQFANPAVIGGISLAPRLLSQHERDVAMLMNQKFQPDQFTDDEQQVQGRVAATRAALGDSALAEALKQKVVSVLQQIIAAERNDAGAFERNVASLGEFIAAFKSGDLVKVGRAVRGSDLTTPVENAYAANPYVLTKAGDYLELQFAEAYKDIAKAAVDAHEEVREQSTLVHGVDDLNLVYKLDCCFEQGFNHIHGLENADIWHEGAANWSAVATGLKTALVWELANP